jgi:hypothetical protein
MRRRPLQYLTITRLVVISLMTLQIPPLLYSQTQTKKVISKVADISDVMTQDLGSIAPDRPRGEEEPRLTEPPRLLDINPIIGARPATATAAPDTSSPLHLDQTMPGPDLPTEKVSDFAGISHDETPVPTTSTHKFIVRTAPPDTNGAVGEEYYVQWVNTSFAIFTKSGDLKYGPARGRTLWKGFDNGPCEKDDDGDPIVQYDKIHKRWIMAQFAISNRDPDGGSVAVPPFYQCIAVSESSNPLGKYRRFRFQYSLFNDYPKLGVWVNGYYATFNMFNDPNAGAQVCAYDQEVMLGVTTTPSRKASQQCVQLDSRYFSLLPADIDGTTSIPPGDAPNYLVNLNPNNSAINLWRFKVNWEDPSKSELTGPLQVANVEDYSVPCLGSSRLACIPQPGTGQKLESMGDRLMYRLAYRRFPDGRESLLFNHVVSIEKNGSGIAALRWYELRNPSGTPTIFQSGTFAPDEKNRWVGSMAMDKLGNIGLAYSVSSASFAPSIYYTGQSKDESKKGRMGKEKLIVDGGGSQTCILPNGDCNPTCALVDGRCISNIARWGDYSSLSMDPSDDCTMWYTTEYLRKTGGFNWSTRIYSFRFTSCRTAQPTSASSRR